MTTPAYVGFTPYIPASSSSPVSPVTPPSSSGTSTVNPLSAPAEWVSLLATLVAPMLQPHPAPAPEGEPSRQHRRVSFNPEVSTISSGPESGSREEPAAAPAEQ